MFKSCCMLTPGCVERQYTPSLGLASSSRQVWYHAETQTSSHISGFWTKPGWRPQLAPLSLRPPGERRGGGDWLAWVAPPLPISSCFGNMQTSSLHIYTERWRKLQTSYDLSESSRVLLCKLKAKLPILEGFGGLYINKENWFRFL